MIKADAKTKNNDTTSAGSGAGAELTARAESLQAYACATRQFLGKDLDNIGQITAKTISDADCDRTLKQSLDLGSVKEGWYYTVIVTANKIFDEVPGASTGKKYKFLRGGSFVDSIYDEWRKFKKGSGITNDNKWNPADIWMMKKTHKHRYDFSTLQDYNKYLYDLFANSELIGISLKKLKEDDPVKSKIFNAGEPITAKFSKIRIGQEMLKSKDVYIEYKSEGKTGEIQLRNFSSRPQPSSWQGEIKGKAAAGGKIGGGILFEGAKSVGVPSSKLMVPNRTPIDKPTDSDFKKFAEAFKRISQSRESIRNLIDEARSGQRSDKTWWMSKYIGVMFVDTILQSKKMNNFASFIFQYASSATKNSSIFIKYS